MKKEKTWPFAHQKGIVKPSEETTSLPFLKFKKDYMVLDIGCGEGILLRNLVERFDVEAYGMDVVPFKGERYGFIKADGQNLPFKDNTFDIVYSLGAIEHFHSPQKAVSESSRVLKRDGQVLFTVPNVFSLHTFIDRPIRRVLRLWLIGVEKSFKASELQNSLEQGGFSKIRYKYLFYNPQRGSIPVRIYKRLDNLVSRLFDFWGFFICVSGTKSIV